MIQAVSKEQTILERLETLTPEQQQSVLDFIEFLQFKMQKQEVVQEKGEVISMLSAAKEFIGCLDSGEEDLSMKKQELKKGYKAICLEK